MNRSPIATSTPSASRSRVNTRTANSEWPPRAKKLSWRPGPTLGELSDAYLQDYHVRQFRSPTRTRRRARVARISHARCSTATGGCVVVADDSRFGHPARHVRMFGDRFSASTSCSKWRHETKLGLDQSCSCRPLKVATHPFCGKEMRHVWMVKRARRGDHLPESRIPTAPPRP